MLYTQSMFSKKCIFYDLNPTHPASMQPSGPVKSCKDTVITPGPMKSSVTPLSGNLANVSKFKAITEARGAIMQDETKT